MVKTFLSFTSHFLIVADNIREKIIALIKIHNSYNEALVAGATFSGTVLEIFFTLISLPLQNILSKYSQDLIKRVQQDFIFVGSFIFLAITFIFNTILITIGATPELVVVSLGFSVGSMLVLALLVVHTFYLLDVRNQLSEIASDIRKQIKPKITKSELKRVKEFKKLEKLLNKT